MARALLPTSRVRAALASALFASTVEAAVPTTTRIDNPNPAADAQFGSAVAVLGDLNGDGTFDLVVGAPGAERAYVISGADHSVIRTLSDPDGLSGYRFGGAVAALGDWNGDGKDEVGVGAPGREGIIPLPCVSPPCRDPQYGRVFVFSGADGSLLCRFEPGETVLFGWAMVSPGDLDGDGQRDLVVGAPAHLRFLGRVYAFSGASGSLLWTAMEGGAGSEPRQPIASFGQALAGLGDLDGDGRPDIVVGAPFFDDGSGDLAGKAFVLSGRTGAEIRTHRTPVAAAENRFGFSVAAIGDQDGDGKGDYAVGDVMAAKVHAYSANGASLGDLTSPVGADLFGVSLAGGSDFDGDGRNDLWVGSLAPSAARLLTVSGMELVRADDPTPGDSLVERAFGLALAAVPSPGPNGPDAVVGEPGEPVSGSTGAGAVFLIRLPRNQPPVADAGLDQLVECSRSETVALDGSGSSDPDGDPLTFAWIQLSGPPVTLATSGATARFTAAPPGAYEFELLAKDDDGASASDRVKVVVRDELAPLLHVALSPSVLWPPNHRLVDVRARIFTRDACDARPTVRLRSITSNEPEHRPGHGHEEADVQGAAYGTDDRSFQLRAERNRRGSARIYTVTYEVTDASGNTRVRTAKVWVPRSRSGGPR